MPPFHWFFCCTASHIVSDYPYQSTAYVRRMVRRRIAWSAMELHPLLTIEEAAGLLRTGRSKAYALAASGQLPVPAVMVGRRRFVRRVDVERFLYAIAAADAA